MLRLTILPALLFLLCSCGGKPAGDSAPAPGDAVAAVGGKTLLQKDLDHAVEQAGSRPAADVLRLLAEEEALAQLAVSEGLDKEPSVRASVRRMLAARVSEKYTGPKSVTDAEVAAVLAAEASAAPAPKPRLHLAFLRQTVDSAGSMDAAVARLEEARTAWKALPEEERGRGFGTLAVNFSDDADTRYQGGDAGWILQGDRHLLLPPEATAGASALSEAGLVPEIVRTGNAAWLVLVLEKAESPLPKPNLEVVRARLAAERAAADRKALLEKALQVSPIRILKQQSTTRAPAAVPSPPGGP